MKAVALAPDDERLITIFKALSHPIRSKMVRYMVEHPQCITGEPVEFADLAQATVSQHLKVLHEAGLVCGTVEGSATSSCLELETLHWFRDQVNNVSEQLIAAYC
jgi:ArsR family transcriptional regulator